MLDVGSGTGRDARLLTRHGYQVTGVDISLKLLEIAKDRCPQATFVHGSVYRLPFEDQTFDGAWAVASLLHVPKNRMQEALLEIRRVLRSGGSLFVALKTGDGERVIDDDIGERLFSFWQPQEFAEQVEAAGLSQLRWHQREASGNNWLCTFAQRS